jgi:preprotein translocase subunit SecB
MAPTSAEKKTIKDTAYADFIASLQLYTVGLVESSCAINRKDYWGKDEEKSISYKFSSKSSSLEDDHFDARSTLSLTMSGEKSKIQMVKIIVAFDLHFHVNVAKQQFVDQFCESEIRLIVWPYFREFVSNTIARMHIPPVILPISNTEE